MKKKEPAGLQEKPDSLLSYERELRFKGYSFIAGVDEAGRGPLAGPVVAAAVILPERIKLYGLDDSKKVPAAKRETLAVQIKKAAVAWSVSLATVCEIKWINIHWASVLAMKRAVEGLDAVPDYILIDGRTYIKELQIPQQVLVGGDGSSASIAAASILAKVTRDHLMQVYHQIYPEYGFNKNKGYPTPAHLKILSSLGPAPIHRTGFAPVKEALKAVAEII
ncbi:MAG TPA: ribonuclease HII [Desulfotomaculum sp.]|nr:MAG: Ribonuclease HII [Desulfotomaculum sp. 46_80]HAG10942.1 ribonuclease HII [Desulfotomaculum sp.]HBY03952.1 ribonuclease HII [Desulfotomaculum sp.]